MTLLSTVSCWAECWPTMLVLFAVGASFGWALCGALANARHRVDVLSEDERQRLLWPSRELEQTIQALGLEWELTIIGPRLGEKFTVVRTMLRGPGPGKSHSLARELEGEQFERSVFTPSSPVVRQLAQDMWIDLVRRAQGAARD